MKAVAPERGADDDQPWRRRFTIGRLEDAAEGSGRSEHIEESSGHECAAETLGSIAPGQAHVGEPVPRQIAEGVRAALKVVEIGGIQRRGVAGAPVDGPDIDGSGSRIQAFIIVKVMVGPATPSAMVVSATDANPGLCRSVLTAY
jgi:hypothetical protein